MDLSVCRHFLDRGFSCSAPGHEDPLETLPSTLGGLYTAMIEYYIHFSHDAAQTMGRMQTTVGVLKKLYTNKKLHPKFNILLRCKLYAGDYLTVCVFMYSIYTCIYVCKSISIHTSVYIRIHVNLLS